MSRPKSVFLKDQAEIAFGDATAQPELTADPGPRIEPPALTMIGGFLTDALGGNYYNVPDIEVSASYYQQGGFYSLTLFVDQLERSRDGIEKFMTEFQQTLSVLKAEGQAPDVDFDAEYCIISAFYLEDLMAVLRRHSTMHNLDWDKSTAQLVENYEEIGGIEEAIDECDLLQNMHAPNGYITGRAGMVEDATRCFLYNTQYKPRPLFTLDDLDRAVIAENIRLGRSNSSGQSGLWFH